jgi:hypothetical protein
MADYTLGDFRRLTKDMPDTMPILKTTYTDLWSFYLASEKPEIVNVKKEYEGEYDLASSSQKVNDAIKSDSPDAITAIVI